MKEPVARYQIRIEGTCLGEEEAADLDQAIRPLLAAHGSFLVLDLSAVRRIDWHGLQIIASAADRARGQGELVVCGATDTVAGVFRLMRLDKKLRMFPNLDEACKAIQA